MSVKSLMNQSFLTRFLSGILLVIIALVTLFIGGNVLFILLTVISLIGLWEIYKVLNINEKLPGYIGYVASAGYYILLYFEMEEYMLLYTTGVLMALMAALVFTFPKYKTEDIMMTFFGLFYVSVMLSFIYRVRMDQDGIYTVWLIFLCSWGCDTFAYLVGMMIGKHKMAPKLSPKKSIEGAVGGVFGAALIGMVYAIVIQNHLDGIRNPILSFALVCGIGAIISQIGDLAASAIKRHHSIKDYGTLIPGHGGILDRFDSVIFTAPLIYSLTLLF